VSYYINPYRITSNFPLVKLKEIIHPRQEKIRLQDFEGKEKVVKKISFADGIIHLRFENKTKMDLYKLYRNDLLVSKINFHQGAVALNYIDDIVCTTHYQPYIIDISAVLPEYLVFALRAKTFLEFIAYLKADGIKNEATYEFIGELEIPLPSRSKQRELIDAYYALIQLSTKQYGEAIELETRIETRICEFLGIKIEKSEIKKGINIFSYKEITKWSVDYILRQGGLSSLKKSTFPVIPLGQIINYIQYGISEKSNVDSKGTVVLRMNNIQNRKIDLKDLKHCDFFTSRLNKEKVILQKGDLLFNRTNSKELVGKAAVFDLEGEYTFASYIIRIRFNDKTNPYYVNFILNSQIGRLQIDLMSRQILGQANINAEEIKEIMIPAPSIEIQNTIVAELNKIVTEQESLIINSEQNKLFAVQEFEKTIFK
jgi:restriction endonuclease S subunit